MYGIAKWISNNILSVLGSTGDGGGWVNFGTVHAKLNAAISEANGAKEIALRAESYAWNANNILTGLNGITGGSVPVVKSVQRGVHAGATGYGTGGIISITISTVNPGKCHIEIYPEQQGSPTTGLFPRPESITATSLTLKRSANGTTSGSTAIPFSWEIIEFY